MSRTRLIRPELLEPLGVALSPFHKDRDRQRQQPEREVEAAVHARLVELYGADAVVRHFTGWSLSYSRRAARIPDLLVVHGEPWREVLVIEVKARRARPEDVDQVGRYVELARSMPGRPHVEAVIAAPGFTGRIPDSIGRLPISLSVEGGDRCLPW